MVATFILVISNLSAYVGETDEELIKHWIVAGALPQWSQYDGTVMSYIVQGIKSIFLHTSLVHLLGNILLLSTSWIVAGKYVTGRFMLLLFLCSSTLGNLVFGFFYEGTLDIIVGCSSGVYAIVTMMLVLILKNGYKIQSKLNKRLIIISLFFISISLIDTFTYSGTLSIHSHITGAILGVISGIMINKDKNS